MEQPIDLTGTYRGVLRLFLPILGITFFNALFPFLEKLFLAQHSIVAVGASLNAVYVSQIFQLPCIAVAMMCQVYVARWQGSRELGSIGPGVWQFMWFAILSMGLTLPFGLMYGYLYFKDTEIQSMVLPYYTFLLGISFLYSLGAALGSFYLGLGKTRLVLWSNIAIQMLRVLLCYCFIFGLEGWIPALGIMGGPVSSLIAQGIFCILLLAVFLQKKYDALYRTRDWFFKIKMFKECLSPCFLRGINRLLCYLCWASIAHLMSSKGGDFFVVLSVGGSVFLFFPCIADAICEAQITVVSQILGKQRYELLNRAYASAVLLVLSFVSIFAIPMLLFPTTMFHILFPVVSLGDAEIRQIFLGLWVSFAFFTLMYVALAHVLSFKDMRFCLLMGAFNWINGFLLMYWMVEKVEIAADQFWLSLSLMHVSTAVLYMWRTRILQARLYSSPQTPLPEATNS